MSILCGVCNTAPSKYKCPTCQLRYCSLACFKPHKESHVLQDSRPSVASAIQAHETAQPPQPVYNIYNLKSNPAFTDLLTRYPNLKSQLAGLWQRTLPPSVPLDMSTAYHERGGRHGGKFNQEKADEAAAAALGRLKDDAGPDNEGIREFVKLVSGLSSGVLQDR